MNETLQELKVQCMGCGKDTTLTLVGGQYQKSYQGSCACGLYMILQGDNDDSTGVPRYTS